MSSNTTSTPLCQSCQTRPRYYDPATGKSHIFCSRTCASTSSSSVSPSSGNCDHCHVRPKYSDGTQNYLFCGKSCAQAAKLAAASSSGAANGIQIQSGTCSFSGCSKPVYQDPSGESSKYCSKTHKWEAETSCLACHKMQSQGGSHFCQTCQVRMEAKAPIIFEVPEQHAVHRSVASQFNKSWRHNTPCPPVRAVYKIVSNKKSLDTYDSYRATVEARGQFLSMQRSAGNENRRWHGTKRQCNLGDKGVTSFCSSKACSLCCIIRTSYDLSLFGKKTGWGRFGSGIYTSSTSSKSNDYSKNGPQSPWKAMLLNKVVVGKGYKLSINSPSLAAPPAGYDSVLAEAGTWLSDDELIVYTNDAVRPSYLVMYDG